MAYKKAVSAAIIALFFAAVIVPAMAPVYLECKTTRCFLNFDECQSMGTGALYDSDALFLSESPSGG